MKNYVIALALVTGLSASGYAMEFENKTCQPVVFSLTPDRSTAPQKYDPQVTEEDEQVHEIIVQPNSTQKRSMEALLKTMKEHVNRHGCMFELKVAARPEAQVPHQWTLGKAIPITNKTDISDIDDMTFIYDGTSCWLKEER